LTSAETAADLVGASAGFLEVRVSKLPRQRGSHRCQRIIDAAKFGDVGEMIARVIDLADDLLDRLHRLDVSFLRNASGSPGAWQVHGCLRLGAKRT